MLAPRHRLAIHAATAVLLAGVAIVATGAGAAATAGSKPDIYGGDATAASVEFRIGRSPLPIPAVTDPFHLWVPYAETSIDSSGGSEGIASTVYPGQDFIGGPNLICNFAPELCAPMPGGGPPNYPDWAHAQYPAHPDDSAQLSQKPFPGDGAAFSVTPNHAAAHADRDQVDATSVTAGSGLAGVVTVASASSNSHQSFKGGALVLEAWSVLKGIDIGGQLHIDEIRSTATAKIDGDKIGVGTANTTVSGATIAGQGVSIDSTGIHAAGTGDKGLLKQTLNSALQKLTDQGIVVQSLGSSKAAKPRKVVASTGGVVVTYTHTVDGPGLPQLGGVENGDYVVIAALGGAGVTAFAGPGVSVSLPDDVPLPSAPPPGRGGDQALPPPTTTPGGDVPTTQQTDTTPNGDQPDVAAEPAPKNAALPIDLTNKRLKTLALVLLGYPLLLLLAAPFRAPSRLPRGG